MEPLALGPEWQDPLPLVSLDEALERSLLSSGPSREQLIARLLADLGNPVLHPLVWVLPRRWRLAPAVLPPRLQGLSALLQQGLISPVFLAALVDDLAHLWPPREGGAPTAVQLWQRQAIDWLGVTLELPSRLPELQAVSGGASVPALTAAAATPGTAPAAVARSVAAAIPARFSSRRPRSHPSAPDFDAGPCCGCPQVSCSASTATCAMARSVTEAAMWRERCMIDLGEWGRKEEGREPTYRPGT